MESRTVSLNGVDDFALLAREWALSEKSVSSVKLVFLRGPRGAGKTTFVSKVAEALSASDAASSSFALYSRYEGPDVWIDHFDLDRLTSADDLESTGFWDVIAEAKDDPAQMHRRFVMIEWADRLPEFGVEIEASNWTKSFRTWSLDFSGPPTWSLHLSHHK